MTDKIIHPPKLGLRKRVATSLSFFSPNLLFVGGILRIIQELILQRPDSIVVVNSLLPRSSNWNDGNTRLADSKYWPTIQTINHMLESFITTTTTTTNRNNFDDFRKVHWFNATSLFLLDDETIDIDLMADLLHPSPTGSRLWLGEVYKIIDGLIS